MTMLVFVEGEESNSHTYAQLLYEIQPNQQSVKLKKHNTKNQSIILLFPSRRATRWCSWRVQRLRAERRRAIPTAIRKRRRIWRWRRRLRATVRAEELLLLGGERRIRAPGI